MSEDERQFLLTAVWLFMRHGRRDRAIGVCEALYEADPRDGVASAALAELLLSGAITERAAYMLTRNPETLQRRLYGLGEDE